MRIKTDFAIDSHKFKKHELYMTSDYVKFSLKKALKEYAEKNNIKDDLYKQAIEVINMDNLFKKATKDDDFSNLIIVRYGGIGDLIALSSIIEYFDCNVHFITNERYYPVFDWFINKDKIKLYNMNKPLFNDFRKTDTITKYSYWAKYQGEGIIEAGNKYNWFEVFFAMAGETKVNTEFLRPKLNKKRIKMSISSNVGEFKIKKYGLFSPCRGTLLICNKATAMMRTINISDILKSLPKSTLRDYNIFVYKNNLSEQDEKLLSKKWYQFWKNKYKNVRIIESSTIETFLLDCYDADMVISVDSGALHFREGIEKPAIGLYNSFTTDSRTKHYKFTKSFDIKSSCELQPCFIHEKPNLKHCPKGTKEDFAAPCFDSRKNSTLIKQLSKIFEREL